MKTALLAAVVSLSLSGCAGAGPVHTSSQLRLDPTELARSGAGSELGTSGVSGIRSQTVNGDPAKPGLYTIMLSVPANTRIEAHTHPDDRSAVVVSGTWHFGYGSAFSDSALRALPPGSFYTEPPDAPHFARTGDTPVVLLITGVGPTGTTYTEAAHDPR